MAFSIAQAGRRPQRTRLAAGILCAAMLAGCAGGLPVLTPSGDAGAGAEAYDTARSAAEAGQYDTAIENYETALAAFPRGKDGAALRVEYAKVLLFADRPARAAEVAQSVPGLTRDDDLRGQAGVLSAIADHELTRAFLAQSPPYALARDRARRSYATLEDAAVTHSAYDAEGVLVARLVQLREDLAALEIARMRAEVRAGEIGVAAQRASYITFEFGDTDAVQQAISELRNVARSGGA